MRQQLEKIKLAATDVSNFLSCRHLARLDLNAAKGLSERPIRYGPLLEELKARGLAHEEMYLKYLQGQGLSIARLDESDTGSQTSGSRVEQTISAMRDGADIIYQAVLADDMWFGRADFLHKVESPSELGNWSYEVIDTKLARETKAGTILQLCVYSHLLEKLQGVRPVSMYVVTPGTDFKPVEYRIDDYSAYFRLLERGIGQFITDPDETYPDLVSHCDLCAWWSECEKRRRGDDHLCYVAGISNSQIKGLRALDVERLADLAKIEEIPDPPQGSKEALARVRDQARVQLVGRENKTPYYEIKEPFDVEHGLALLPVPTTDDIFLDFEGNHFAEKGVQEYLTGFVFRGADGQFVYKSLWARTLEEEQKAFEYFMDVATATRARNPEAHIYHFAPYEPTALKRLMGRFATREVELDELLRGNAFVDLYSVVRRALIASVERYSIKDLEPFFDYVRQQDLHDAAMSRRLVEHAIEAGDLDETLDEHRRIVEDYNREDCESARRLRDWLEQLRAEVVAQGHDVPRPILQEGEASEAISDLDRELQRLRNGLLEGVPMDPEGRSAEQQARFILAHMMEFHRREDKASWWEYFRVLELEEGDYADERRAITGLHFAEEVKAGRAPLHRYNYPSQEIDARRGDELRDVDGSRFGTVVDVNYSDRMIDIKKRMDTADVHPHALLLHSQVSAKTLRESLMRLGEVVLAEGFTSREPYKAAIELLLRRPSPLVNANGALQRDDEKTVDAACRLAGELDGHVLAIQGPPGTGKTYTGAHMICALKNRGLKVGVTAVSHKVIVNLLESAMKEARKQGMDLNAVHRQDGEYEGDWGIERKKDYPAIRRGLEDGSIDVVGATAWCWSRPDFEQSVDVLIVDEAGQMSLSNVLAVAPAGRSLVLLGDPQQLEQPLQSSHPEGSEVSALYHLLDGEDTISLDKGLFLAETYRLHPDITRFTSEAYYEGKVSARPELEYQAIMAPLDGACRFTGSGLRYVPVHHTGNQARSPEEAEAVREIVTELLDHASWQDKDQKVSKLTERDILIVAPYNAQVAALTEVLPMLGDRIGTVDRFQGQEAPVVVYSMTSSSPEDAPRGMGFLYDRHRFNVATSRALALCILVGSPALFEPECKTPRQMKMANGFCRYLELAQRA
ncbi:MAG: TM0106 family RecB-like putative nuclease [Candidatus Thiodiazotropha sp. (ex Ctena orbiculata)]|uniref:TM0106 family RecB-like putative nuclease n=1 Tax=Candidatus Thiodiazotropha taylori TaxID=2792791 RepID=A0A944QVF9_9GAMM|nr:TM0106 family RecB-like putative nuclease [Candidatus Thiodiazotropha taylori]